MEKRLEAGWLQRIAWSVLVWGSLGLLVWVPFLYVAIRRRRGSDWGAFAAFVLYEGVTVTWMSVLPDQDDGDAVLGIVIILCLLAATLMLLLAMFDRRAAGAAAAPQAHGAGSGAYGAVPGSAASPGPYGNPYRSPYGP
ncbi:MULTISPECIES: hypothetical protein [unclassified Streptomyces]|uniref:hypothetical protein n=1 Tax=unclassified Streptomyces TaxID=2593676 RepID=UPI0007DD6DB4|nr:hypothetical protein [Streptomyces sp. SAT1]ANH91903.1 hypothetical protein A8713_12620 [Streptomyces sp. SAT1]